MNLVLRRKPRVVSPKSMKKAFGRAGRDPHVKSVDKMTKTGGERWLWELASEWSLVSLNEQFT